MTAESRWGANPDRRSSSRTFALREADCLRGINQKDLSSIGVICGGLRDCRRNLQDHFSLPRFILRYCTANKGVRFFGNGLLCLPCGIVAGGRKNCSNCARFVPTASDDLLRLSAEPEDRQVVFSGKQGSLFPPKHAPLTCKCFPLRHIRGRMIRGRSRR